MNIRNLLTSFLLLFNISLYGQCDIELEPLVVDVLCSGDSDGSISVFANGGVYPYDYIWSNGDNSSYIFNLSGGDYTVTVTDIDGCSMTGTYTVGDPDPVTVNTVLFENISCDGEEDGHIIVEGMGGTLDSGTSTVEYYYQWSSGQVNVTELTNLSSGTYTVTVSDLYGCSGSAVYVVTNPPEIYVTFPNVTDLTCNGDSSGEISIFAGGGTGTLFYSWSNGQTGNTISNLQAGTYDLTITDVNGCEFMDSYTVNEPPAFVESPAIITDLDCYQDGSGEIVVFISGGTGTLSYAWSNGGSTSTLDNLQGGTYTLTVTDAVGCTYTNSYSVFEPFEFVIDQETIVDIDCNGNSNGSIEITLEGGTPFFSYQWSNGSTDNFISNLESGSYTLTATDGNGCELIETYTISEPSPLEIILGSIEDVTCAGAANGSIETTTIGGSPSYTYSWSNGATTASISGVSSGTYTLTSTDENGCTVSESYIISEPSPLEIILGSIEDVTCAGDSNGSIETTTIGGSPSYTYSWSNGATTASISGLSSGTYTLTSTDENGCTVSESYIISEPSPLEIILGSIEDVTCAGDSNGSIETTTIGGSPSYTYSWSNGATTASISGLSSGTYTLTSTDENGCTVSESYIISEPSPLEIILGSIEDVTCAGDSNGSIETTTTGGSPSYTYSWSNGATTASISGVSSGTYTLTSTDENGCTLSESYIIAEPSPLEIILGSIEDVTCAGDSNGSIETTAIGGSPSYTYSWSNGATTASILGLSSGSYTLTTTDENGCTISDTYTIIEPEAIAVSVDIEDIECGGGATGSISITNISGGTGDYDVLWSTGATTLVIDELESGSYSLTITDENDCEFIEDYSVSQPGDLDITSFEITDNLCAEDNTGSISVEISGGSGNLEYMWSTGTSTSEIQNLVNGEYSVTITDENGCNLVATYEVSSPEELGVADFNIIDVKCNGEEDGVISFLPTGGLAPYFVEWTYTPVGQSTPQVFTQDDVTGATSLEFAAGIVDIKITDDNNCLKELETVTISEPEEISYSVPDVTSPICYGDTFGIVAFTIEGGISPYAVEWTYTPSGSSETFIEWTYNITGEVNKNFGSGSVTPRIIDANNCELTGATISISDPSLINYNDLIVVSPACFADTNGMVSFKPMGGASPYSVEWTYTPSAGDETFVKWSYNVTDEVVQSFPAGIIMPVLIDSNGCETIVETIILTQPEELELTTIIIEDAQCYGDTTGIVGFDVSGGIAPFIIEWTYTPLETTAPSIFTQESTDGKISQLFPEGVVTALISDSNGCTIPLPEQEIKVKNEIIIEVFDVEDPKCGVDSSGTISLLLSGGSSPYAIEWTYIPAGGTETFVEWTYNITDLIEFNFGAGIVSGQVEDANGCTVIIDEVILNSEEAIGIEEIKVTYSEGLGNIELVLDDVNDQTTFLWTGPNGFVSTEQNLVGIEEGVYSCVITDENGCETLTGNVEVITTSVQSVDNEMFEVSTLSLGSLLINNKLNQSCTVSCVNMQGQALVTTDIPQGESVVDISNLPSGIYVLLIHNGKDVYTQLFSKN